MILRQTLALAEKELKLDLRFKLNYIGLILLDPLRYVLLFIVVYSSFYAVGAGPLGIANKENYLPFLFLGTICHSFFKQGFGEYSSKFFNEKWWQTINALFLAPMNRFVLLAGVGLSALVKLIPPSLILFSITYAIYPISVIRFMLVLVVLLLMYAFILGVGMLRGVFAMSNENVLFIFDYIMWGLGFLSCFYYPLEALPKIIHPFVLINPVYHGVYLMRVLWFNEITSTPIAGSLAILVASAVIMPTVSVILFNKVWKKLGVVGY